MKNIKEAAQEIGITHEECVIRARKLGINPNADLSDENFKKLRDFAPIAVADRRPQTTEPTPPTPKKAEPKKNTGTLSDVLAETNKAIQAAKKAGEHLDSEFLDQQQQSGRAIGTLASLLKGAAIAQKTIEVDSKIYRALIEDSQQRIATVAHLALSGGDEIPKLYHSSVEIHSENYELPIAID